MFWVLRCFGILICVDIIVIHCEECFKCIYELKTTQELLMIVETRMEELIKDQNGITYDYRNHKLKTRMELLMSIEDQNKIAYEYRRLEWNCL